jgi:hypothetical protein
MNAYIEIPSEVYKALRRASIRNGKDLATMVIESILKSLDPKSRIEIYMKLYERYLKDAEELTAKGDFVQASEKYWGAVTAILNAIGEIRGWDHYTHRDYNVIIENLYEETGDKDLLADFSIAERLHSNFYHNFMRKSAFGYHRERVSRLIEKLRKIAMDIQGGSKRDITG